MVLKNQFKSVVESSNGPSLMIYCPELELLPELIHPLMLGIYCYIKAQSIQDSLKEEKLKHMNNMTNVIIS